MMNIIPQALEAAKESGETVTIWMINGYQMHGVITAYDHEAVILEVEDGRKLIMLRAISTVFSPGAEAPEF